MNLEWDDAKREGNIDKHGLDFPRAATIFQGEHLTLPAKTVEGEPRHIAIGPITPPSEVPSTWSGPLAVVVYTMRGDDTIRIISARRARSNERKHYKNEFGGPR